MKRAVARLLAGVPAVWLAGCMGQRAAIPADAVPPVPADWRTTPASVVAERGTDIWQAFGDPELAALVAAAGAHNADVALAATRVEQARAQFRLARAQQGPALNAMIAGGREREVNPFGQAELQTAGQAELTLAYEPDLFGRLRNSSAAARATLLASRYAADGVRLAVSASTASAYIALRAQDARLGVLQDTLQARARSLKLAQRRYDAGYATALDLHQAEAEYRATEQQIPTAELARARLESGLSVLLGEPPSAIRRGLPLTGLQLPRVPAVLPSELLRQRPDIAQAEQQLVAADRALDAARAAFMPSVKLGADGGYVISSLLDDPIGIFSIGGSVLAPLFDSGRLRAQRDAATARRDEAAYGYRRSVLNAFREVEDALAALRERERQEQALLAQQRALDSALAQAMRRYRAGYSPYLEQLDAQRNLLGAELAVLQARADRLTATVALYEAIGGGWQAPPDLTR